MPFAAIIPLVLQNLPAIVKLGQAGISFLTGLRAAAKQTAEWTDEHEAQFQAGIQADALSEEWQQDKK